MAWPPLPVTPTATVGQSKRSQIAMTAASSPAKRATIPISLASTPSFSVPPERTAPPQRIPTPRPTSYRQGGTTLNTDNNGNFLTETAFNSGGGGPSQYEARPFYQNVIASIVGSARGTPDISYDANTKTGVSVYDSYPYEYQGQTYILDWAVAGGTSVSSPALAGIANLAATSENGFPAGSQALLANFYTNYANFYTGPGAIVFRDITSGNNGYPAMVGWDFVTGVGSCLGLPGLWDIGTPTANPQSIGVARKSPGTAITLTGSDPDSPALPMTFAITTVPANGTLSGFDATTGAVTYKPNANFQGSDSFAFTVTNDFNLPTTPTITDAFYTSTAVTVTLNVSGVPTATTASSAPNPSVFGEAVTFTSTTTSTAGVPAGTVTFTEGATVWASNVPVNGSGRAAFTTTALAVGGHTLTAAITGAGEWANSSANAAAQVVKVAATTTAVSSSANPSVYSEPVTLSATVTTKAGGSAIPTGTVTFEQGSTTLFTAALDASGQATYTISSLTVGSHAITTVYHANSSFGASKSGVLTQTVNKDATTSSVGSSMNPSLHGQQVTFTATVTADAPGTGVVTGSVVFKDGAKTLKTVTLTGGSAGYTTSSLSRGTHNISVVYSGNARFVTSTSAVVVQTVD